MAGEQTDTPLRTFELGLWGPEGRTGSRHWPDEELDSDRWERARRFGFGEDSCVHYSSYIYGNVKAGSHVWIGPFTLVDASGDLEIGDFTMICAGVQIYSHDSVRWALSAGEEECEKAPVRIGSRCYIGAGSIITKGVTIGDGSVVGAGSLVNRDLPPGSIAVGSPARVIGRVERAEDGRVCFTRDSNPLHK